jgi:hypothetical protein
MINWLEVLVWFIGFSLLCVGIIRKTLAHNERRTWIAITSGLAILLGGTLFWYSSAVSLAKLSETLQVITPTRDPIKEKIQIKDVAPSQRREVSIKLAKAAYANGESNLQVLTENGSWIPFTPDDQDKKSRESQLKALEEIAQQRTDLIEGARIAKQQSKQWIASLLVALAAGFTVGLFFKRAKD